jgi:hypothetical protein
MSQEVKLNMILCTMHSLQLSIIYLIRMIQNTLQWILCFVFSFFEKEQKRVRYCCTILYRINSNTQHSGSFQFETHFSQHTTQHNSNGYENSQKDYTQWITLFEMFLLSINRCWTVYNSIEKGSHCVRMIRHFTIYWKSWAFDFSHYR